MTQIEIQHAKDRFVELIELAASAKGLFQLSSDFDAPLEEFTEQKL